MERHKGHPLVTVIVPVYRVERYLDQCVQSILSQTYRELEIILVDDGSPDGCPAMCDGYAAADSRVKVIHKKNGGVASAREAGLASAKGQYMMMVDGDDWIDSETVERCVYWAETESVDCVLFGYVREYPNRSISNPLFSEDVVYDTEEAEEKVHRRLIGPVGSELRHPERLDNFSTVWGKLYHRETAQKGYIVSERVVGTSEDTVFNLYALEDCRLVGLRQCFYHYRKADQQSIASHYKTDLVEKWDILYEIIQRYVAISEKRETYHTALLGRVACGMLGLGIHESNSGENIRRQGKRVREILERPLYREAFRQVESSSLPLHWKVFFRLCKHRAGICLVLLFKMLRALRGIKTA